MRKPQEINQDIAAARQEIKNIEKRIERLEFEMKCAIVFPNRKGWAGVYEPFPAELKVPNEEYVFPVGEFEFRPHYCRVDPCYIVKDGKLYVIYDLYTEYKPIENIVEFGQSAKIEHYTGQHNHVGFFATEEGARQFVEKTKAEIENKK